MATSTPVAWWPLDAMEAASESAVVASGRLSMAAAAMTQLGLKAEEAAAMGAAAVDCSADVFKKVQAYDGTVLGTVSQTPAYPKATPQQRGASAMASRSTGLTSKSTTANTVKEACIVAIGGAKETLSMAVRVMEQAREALALAEQAVAAAEVAAQIAETTWTFPPT
jgi:hypothetical protein